MSDLTRLRQEFNRARAIFADATRAALLAEPRASGRSNTELQGLAELQAAHAAMDQCIQAAYKDARTEFLDERIAELPARDLPRTDDERADLARRLLEAASEVRFAEKIQASAPLDLTKLDKSQWDQQIALHAKTELSQLRTPAATEKLAANNRFYEKEMRAYEKCYANGIAARDSGIDFEASAWMHRARLALVWPTVLAEWLKARARPFAVPAALVEGQGAPGRFFGGQKPGDLGRMADDPHRVIVRSGGAQLTLFSHLFPTVEKTADLMRQIDAQLGNRAFRVLLACFSAAEDDHRTGRATPGDFFYSPTRLADSLGFAREKNGKGAPRQSDKNRDAMDATLAELMNATIHGTFKAGGVERALTVEGLVVDQRVTLGANKAGAKTGPGRRPERLLRISPGLLGMLKNGAAFFHMDAKTLRPPKGIDQRTWDDAFKVFCVVAAHARLNPTKASSGEPLPWVRMIDTLLTDANTASRGRPPRKARSHLVGKLLPALVAGGFLTFDADGERIRYDVPTIRPELDPIAERIEARKAKALLAGTSKPQRRRAGRKPEAPATL